MPFDSAFWCGENSPAIKKRETKNKGFFSKNRNEWSVMSFVFIALTNGKLQEDDWFVVPVTE